MNTTNMSMLSSEYPTSNDTGNCLVLEQPEENSYSRFKRLANMDNSQVSKSLYGTSNKGKSKILTFMPLIAVIIFVVFYESPTMPLYPTAQSCLAILITCAFCWATEAVPSYVTAFIVPCLSIWLKVGYDKTTGRRIPATEFAPLLSHQFMDPIILVFLGSLTISAGLTKLSITDRASVFILSHIPPRPKLILFALMLINYVVAAFLSNVASTTLVISFSTPIIRNLDPEEPFINAILFGIAWSGNVGGMVTPISSPQNVIALGKINTGSSNDISFVQWMGFAFPASFCILCLYWLYLILRYRTKLETLSCGDQNQDFSRWTWKHTLACIVTVCTIILWALQQTLSSDLGHIGITSLIPVIVFFSTGILTSEDFGALRWSTLILMGGGLAMGEAMDDSGLLDIVAEKISGGLSNLSFWVVLLIMLTIISILTSVINHTSAAAILFPVLAKIGDTIGNKKTLLTISALMISGSQLFHISSFPNAIVAGFQRHLRMDKSKLTSESFLTGTDFIITGWPTIIAAILVLSSVAYGIVCAMKLK